MNTRTLQRIIVGLSFVACFAPVVLLTRFYFPFIVPKTIFFRSIVEFMFVLWAVLAFRDASFRPRVSSKTTIAFGAFVLLVFISSIAGLDPTMSLWGDFERMWGFNTIAHMFLFFLVLSTTLNARDWLRIFQINLVVAFLVSLYGFAQVLGMPVQQNFSMSGVDRIVSTLGNASYVGAYMLLAGAIACYLFVIRAGNERWWYAASAVISAFTLFLSATRGAFLGAIAGLLLLCIGVAVCSPRKKVRTGAGALLGAMVLVAIIITVFHSTVLVQGNPFLRRLTNFDLQNNTSQTRLIGWSSGLKGFLDRPLVGWGEENYIVAFNKYFVARFYTLAPSETYFDRAHNQFIDTLVSEGMFGFLSYVLIYAFAIAGVFRLWRARAVDINTFLLLSVVPIAYLVQDFFVFDTLAPFLLMLVILAFAEHLARVREVPSVRAPQRTSALQPQHVIFALAVWVFLLWFINIRTAVASNLGAWTLVDWSSGITRNVSTFKTVTNYRIPAVRDVRNSFVDFVTAKAGDTRISSEALREAFTLAGDEVEKNLAAVPEDVLSGSKAMKLYNIRYALFGDFADLERAEALYTTLIPHAPERLELLFLGAQTRTFAGDFDEALRRFDRAKELNGVFPDTSWFRGLVLLDTGKSTSTAVTNLKEGLKLGYHPARDQLSRALAAAEEMDDVEFVRDLAREFVQREESAADVWRIFALASRDLGDHESARTAAERAIALDPKMAQELDPILSN